MAYRYPRSQAHRLTLVRMDDRAVLNIGAVADHDPIIVAANHAVEPHACACPKPNVADHGSAGRYIVFIIGRLDCLVAKRINHANLRRKLRSLRQLRAPQASQRIYAPGARPGCREVEKYDAPLDR